MTVVNFPPDTRTLTPPVSKGAIGPIVIVSVVRRKGMTCRVLSVFPFSRLSMTIKTSCKSSFNFIFFRGSRMYLWFLLPSRPARVPQPESLPSYMRVGLMWTKSRGTQTKYMDVHTRTHTTCTCTCNVLPGSCLQQNGRIPVSLFVI